MSGHHHHHFHTDAVTDYYIYRRTTGETDNRGEGGGFWALFWLVIIVGAFAWGWVTGTALPWLLHSGPLLILVVVLIAAVAGRRMLTTHSLRQADEAWAAYSSGARRLNKDRPSAADLQQLEHETAQQIASIRDQANLQAKRDGLFAEEVAQLQAMKPTQPPSPLEIERAAHRANLRAIGAPYPPRTRTLAGRAAGKDKKAQPPAR